jgi:hypothetical protein
MRDASTGPTGAARSCTPRNLPTDCLALYQVATGDYTIRVSRCPPAPPSCELSVRSVVFQENAMSDTMKRKFAEARVYAAQVRARKAMGDKWILADVQKRR